ncbi:RluA family pseudouridine synthase [Insulibacter thermoxylanivorax]|uniref:RluA family pseudouridine synthase n=1 Tax=Insulibacter thermoxylanivorax TaxID=2749268 RepID=UPI001910E929|nr:RNA pseudouridine synthase [Insulibacter thermoxylanivorax]
MGGVSLVQILYEDNHILVAVKPPNMLSQEDASGDPDILSILKQDIKVRYNKPGNVYLGLVHRLDRPVGGVMVFARTSKAASRLSDQVRRRDVHKRYWAIVYGRPPRRTERLEHYLVKNHRTNMVSVTSNPLQGKSAILTYHCLDTIDPFSLLDIELETGRPHQIRVQLSQIGCPIFGDQRYGRDVNQAGQQIALWSYRLQFTHPVKKEPMQFTSMPPDAYPWNLFDLHNVLI